MNTSELIMTNSENQPIF